jgi:hypothetical protein
VNNNFYFIHLYKMKKQDKYYLIFGLLAVLLITLWSASWQLQEGFKEGARPISKSTASTKTAPSLRPINPTPKLDVANKPKPIQLNKPPPPK